MAKTKRRQPPPIAAEVPYLWPWEWARADLRLDYMEARAKVALREGYSAARIMVADVPMPDLPDLWKPGQVSGLIVGPDGKPLDLSSVSSAPSP